MFYAFNIPIAANTAAASPVTEDLKLTAGIITWVGIQFPSGCDGFAHCVLQHEGHQWLPTNPDDNFCSSGYVIPIAEHYEIREDINIVKFVGWNLDDTYDHTVTVYVNILRAEDLEVDRYLKYLLVQFLQKVSI